MRVSSILLGLAGLWTFLEFARPSFNPPNLMLGITIVLFGSWIIHGARAVSRGDVWLFVFLAAGAIGVFTAFNNFSAYMATRMLGLLILGICLPLKALLDDVNRIRVWMYAFWFGAVFVGLWATTHGGYGPAGSHGHDENYVAAIVTTAAGIAYFSAVVEPRRWMRFLLLASILVFLLALAVAINPSRGGFIALCCVGLYVIFRSPRPGLALGTLAAAAVILALLAPDAFWNEIATTTDTSEGGTGDARLEYWKSGYRMWQQNPVFGVGPDNFRWNLGAVQTEEQWLKFGRPLDASAVAHSMWVELLAEFGAVGTIAVLALLWNAWRGLGRVVQDGKSRPSHGAMSKPYVLACLADGLRAAILSVCVNGVFLSLLHFSHIWVLLAVSGATIRVHSKMTANQRPSPATVPSRYSAQRVHGRAAGAGL